MIRHCRLFTSLLGAAVLFLNAVPQASAQKEPEPLPVGLVDSILDSLSPAKRELLETDLPAMIKEFTEIKTSVQQGGDPFTAVKKLASGEWRLALFPGVEYAWADAKDPKLRPLLLATDGEKQVHAFALAKKDSPLDSAADLKGKNVRVLKTKEAARFFAKKTAGGEPAKFFGKLEETSVAPDALDDVLRGKLDAAIVDGGSLANYKSIYPGRFDRLKVVAKSDPFPPVVIAYYEGGLSEATLKKLRQGMGKANETQKGRESLSSVGMTALDPVPADFPQILEKVRKSHPAP